MGIKNIPFDDLFEGRPYVFAGPALRIPGIHRGFEKENGVYSVLIEDEDNLWVIPTCNVTQVWPQVGK